MNKTSQISVQNAQRKLRVDLKALRQFASRALGRCTRVAPPRAGELKKLGAVRIVLVSDARMAALHKTFMNIASPTDVLTFQHGEIFISVETAAQNAARFRTTMDREIRLYLVHGLLHLAGFDDTSAAQAREMSSLQRRIVAASGAEAAARGGPV